MAARADSWEPFSEAVQADIPPPPGFEEPVLDDLDTALLDEFAAFMAEPSDSPPEPPGPCSGNSNLVNEESATIEVKPWKDPGAKAGDAFADEAAVHIDTSAKFQDLCTNPDLLRGVYEMGFVRPSKIQAAALPHICHGGKGGGQNMIGQAQNGSGKTATFTLALLTALDIAKVEAQALVICPTRELATQVDAVVSALGKFLPVKTQLVLPGLERVPRNPECHVLIGTPGKILDLSKKRILDVSSIRVFVLDEADVMLDQDNNMGPQVTQVRRFLPDKVQVLFFSATFPDGVRAFAESLVPKAVSIKVSKAELTVSSINQFYLRCETRDDKFEKLSSLYSVMNVGQSVIFANSRRGAFVLARRMKEAGHAVSLICGTQTSGEEKMDPALRDKVMGEFRRGVTRVLIATDVLSRGIDVPQVTLVVNYELPVMGNMMEAYLHRVGRTGRFGLRGIAVNLVVDADVPTLSKIQSYFACQIPEMDADVEALEQRLRNLR